MSSLKQVKSKFNLQDMHSHTHVDDRHELSYQYFFKKLSRLNNPNKNA